jgi:hypothetical protein
MTDILSVSLDFERSFLEELVDDLKGTFHCIAHAGKYKDKKFIESRQKYIKQKYENGLQNCISFEAGMFIGAAYDKLQDMLKNYKTSEQIIEVAEEALYVNLMEGITDDEAENFRVACQSSLA